MAKIRTFSQPDQFTHSFEIHATLCVKTKTKRKENSKCEDRAGGDCIRTVVGSRMKARKRLQLLYLQVNRYLREKLESFLNQESTGSVTFPFSF